MQKGSGGGVSRFNFDIDQLCRRVVLEKYNIHNTWWITLQGRGLVDTSVWRGIANGYAKFKEHTAILLGRGSWISFREDTWCRGSLNKRFLKLYNMGRIKT